MTWDEYFMGLAKAVSRKSKDPSTKVGAVLVDSNHRLISAGINGFPRGLADDQELLRDREVKLALTIHAEQNALLFAERSVRGATCYVWPMPPCAQCAAKLIQAGVVRVVAPEPTVEQYDRWGKSLALAEWAYAKTGVVLDIYTGDL